MQGPSAPVSGKRRSCDNFCELRTGMGFGSGRRGDTEDATDRSPEVRYDLKSKICHGEGGEAIYVFRAFPPWTCIFFYLSTFFMLLCTINL